MDSNNSDIRARASGVLDILVKDSKKENTQKDLKVQTLQILLMTIMGAAAAAFVFLLYTSDIVYSYIIQLFVILACLLLLWRLKRGDPTERIAVITVLWYGFIMIPLVWSELTVGHPMISILLCFICVMTVLLFDGKLQRVLLAAAAVMLVIMMIYDGHMSYSEDSSVLQEIIGRGIGVLITGTMIVYGVFMFKKKFNEISNTLYRNSIIDPLTGAYNARMLDSLLAEYKNIYQLEKANFAIALIDMDNFKTVNDTYGHDVGDEMLKKFSNAINEGLREGDVLARYGGDEFIIILPGCNRVLAGEVVDRLMESVKFLKIDSTDVAVTFSAGISDMSESEQTETDIFKLADMKMYKAKDMGRHIVYIDSIT